MGKIRILVVDDDHELGAMMVRYFGQYGMEAVVADCAITMDRLLAEQHFDLAVLDLMLPGEDGLSITRRIASELPVIILSARGEESDRILGLDLGADDYLPKPFSAHELLARIQAVLRRRERKQPEASSSSHVFGDYHFDAANHTLTWQGEPVRITSGDRLLLKVFCEHPRQVLSREQLVLLAGDEGRLPYDRSIDVRITRLRRKIEVHPEEPCFIRTIRGVGYLFSPEGCG